MCSLYFLQFHHSMRATFSFPESFSCCLCSVMFGFFSTDFYRAMGLHVVRLSVRLSVALVDQDHIGWKSWKLIARTIIISLTHSLFVAQRPSTYSLGNMGKFAVMLVLGLGLGLKAKFCGLGLGLGLSIGWPWPWYCGLGLRGLALAKNSRPKSWRTTMFTMNFHWHRHE